MRKQIHWTFFFSAHKNLEQLIHLIFMGHLEFELAIVLRCLITIAVTVQLIFYVKKMEESNFEKCIIRPDKLIN